MKDNELVKKWAVTGLLRFVKPEELSYVAVRLEMAAQAALQFNDKDYLEQEIVSMRKQGLFGSR